MANYGPEFYFDGMKVGLFLGAGGPDAPGRHHYMPYRSFGHYKVHSLLRAGGSPRCCFEADGQRITFTVVGCSEYGVLELSDFENMPFGTA